LVNGWITAGRFGATTSSTAFRDVFGADQALFKGAMA
jgi:hypothetical protein